MAQNAAGDQPTAQSQADQPPGAPAQATDQPPVIQKIRGYIQKNPIVQKLQGDGFYPRIGGLSPGSGLAGGAGYRRHLNWAYVDVSGAVSTKAYRGIDATAGWIATKHVDLSTKLTFRNNTQDATGVRERVSMAFFKRLGQPASRESFTRLYINNVYQGIYAIVEPVDGDFVARAFGEKSG